MRHPSRRVVLLMAVVAVVAVCAVVVPLVILNSTPDPCSGSPAATSYLNNLAADDTATLLDPAAPGNASTLTYLVTRGHHGSLPPRTAAALHGMPSCTSVSAAIVAATTVPDPRASRIADTAMTVLGDTHQGLGGTIPDTMMPDTATLVRYELDTGTLISHVAQFGIVHLVGQPFTRSVYDPARAQLLPWARVLAAVAADPARYRILRDAVWAKFFNYLSTTRETDLAAIETTTMAYAMTVGLLARGRLDHEPDPEQYQLVFEDAWVYMQKVSNAAVRANPNLTSQPYARDIPLVLGTTIASGVVAAV